MGKVRDCFVFLCACTVDLSFCASDIKLCMLGFYLSFCATGIKLCMPGCPAVLAWLHLQVRGKCMKIHMQLVFFTRVKQPRTFPTICSNLCATATFKAGCQQLPAVWRANTWTSRVDGDTEQLFGPADLVSCITCVLHMHKGFQLWTLKVVLRQKS